MRAVQENNNYIKVIAKQVDHCLKPNILGKVQSDYLKFFTDPEGADMSSYLYLDNSNCYDKLVSLSQDYYLCRDHIQLIKHSKHKYKKYFDEVTDIIEIGPGSDYVIKSKTLPILGSAENLKNYHIIDNCKKFLQETSSLIKSYLPKTKIYSIEADLTSDDDIKISNAAEGKKCILFLGGTLANFREEEQRSCLKKINQALNPGDLFIVTADTNQDEKSLIAAYANQYSKNLDMVVINHYACINLDFAKHAQNLEVCSRWNKEEFFVDLYFRATKNFSFQFPGYGDILIKEGQEFRGLRAYKRTQEQNIQLLNQCGFHVTEVLCDDNNTIEDYICIKL